MKIVFFVLGLLLANATSDSATRWKNVKEVVFKENTIEYKLHDGGSCYQTLDSYKCYSNQQVKVMKGRYYGF